MLVAFGYFDYVATKEIPRVNSETNSLSFSSS